MQNLVIIMNSGNSLSRIKNQLLWSIQSTFGILFVELNYCSFFLRNTGQIYVYSIFLYNV